MATEMQNIGLILAHFIRQDIDGSLVAYLDIKLRAMLAAF